MNPFGENDPRHALWAQMQAGASAPAPVGTVGQSPGGALTGSATDPNVFGTPGGMTPPEPEQPRPSPFGAMAPMMASSPSTAGALRAGGLSTDKLPGMDNFGADGAFRQSSTGALGYTGGYGDGPQNAMNGDIPGALAAAGGPAFQRPAPAAPVAAAVAPVAPMAPIAPGRQPPAPMGALSAPPAHSDAAELAASQRGDTAAVVRMQAAQNALVAPQGGMAPLTVTPDPQGGDAAMFKGVEGKYGLPDGYLGKIGAIESRNGQNMSTRLSSAKGYFQFIDSTAKQYGVDVNSTASGADGAARLAVANRAALAKGLGIAPSEVTGAQLYLAHQQGAAGAVKLLSNPDASAESLIGAAAAKANGGAGLTGGQMANKWMSTYDRSTMGKGRGLPMKDAPLNQGPGSGGSPRGALSSGATPPAPAPQVAVKGADGADGEDTRKSPSGALAGFGGGGSKSRSAPVQFAAEKDHEADLSFSALIKRRGKIVKKGALGNGRTI